DALASLQPAHLRAVLPGFMALFIADPDVQEGNMARTTRRVQGWSDETCELLLEQLQHLGETPKLYDPHPESRGLSRDWMQDVMNDVRVQGLQHLKNLDGPVVFIANHLSYVDSTAVDCALTASGRTDVADRIVSVAGPKVYSDTFRRIATSCIATLPVPQSQAVATGGTPTSPRELARQAIRSIRAAEALLLAGRHLLLYPEGGRSRTGRLGPFLPGVHRYLALDAVRAIPLAISGTQQLMPIGQDKLHPGSLSVRFGEPVLVSANGGPKAVLPLLHERLADLLPDDQKPE
ncbi:MAG: lysophospholipid acyltransferase family protein, partial [Myxococcota bacterium]